MPKFESPLGTKQLPNAPMKDFSVPDESEYFQQQPSSPQYRNSPQESIAFDPQAMREFQESMQPQHNPFRMKELTETEKQILEAKKAKREGKERLSEGARRRIELLIGMTRMTKSVDIEGKIFVLQTLKVKEVRDGLAASVPFDGTIHFSFETARQSLARSLVQVAGTDIEQFIGSSELEDKLIFIDELPQSLFTRLYNEYVALDNEAREKFSIKTEKDVKEVVDALKK